MLRSRQNRRNGNEKRKKESGRSRKMSRNKSRHVNSRCSRRSKSRLKRYVYWRFRGARRPNSARWTAPRSIKNIRR